MSRTTQLVLGARTEDELRLPRPPGVIRQFWARHPRLADWLIVTFSLLLAVPTFTMTAEESWGSLSPVFALSLAIATSVVLLWRRRAPIVIFAAASSPLLFVDPLHSAGICGIAPALALYSVAVYRSTRAAMLALAAAAAALAIACAAWMWLGSTSASNAIVLLIGSTFLWLLGALIGVNVGGRKRYVEALIDRSHQLATERDQQALLAAAAERTRIAREMHDIVSHSLTVVVALAEGAHATDDAGRAKQASRAIADTARESLAQMRVMLGVLRDAPSLGDAAENAAPAAPLLTQTPADVVGRAREAGLPVTLTVSGSPGGSERARLATLRIVQEGLTNALRYAHDPSRVHVAISYAQGRIRVRIDNDGCRSGELSRGAGLGIHGLQERVAALGGTVQAGPVGEASWALEAEFDREEPHE